MSSKGEEGIEGMVVLHMMYRKMDIQAFRHLHYLTTAAPHP